MVSAPARRQQVAYARTRGVSERRACALMSVSRSALHYESRLIKKDAPTLAATSILSAQYPRYGYRRIHVFLERQGHRMSIDRAWRLWQKGGFQVLGNVRGIALRWLAPDRKRRLQPARFGLTTSFLTPVQMVSN
jgi:putative transposase